MSNPFSQPPGLPCIQSESSGSAPAAMAQQFPSRPPLPWMPGR